MVMEEPPVRRSRQEIYRGFPLAAVQVNNPMQVVGPRMLIRQPGALDRFVKPVLSELGSWQIGPHQVDVYLDPEQTVSSPRLMHRVSSRELLVQKANRPLLLPDHLTRRHEGNVGDPSKELDVRNRVLLQNRVHVLQACCAFTHLPRHVSTTHREFTLQSLVNGLITEQRFGLLQKLGDRLEEEEVAQMDPCASQQELRALPHDRLGDQR